MDVDRNKDLSHYFDDSDQGNEKQVNIQLKNSNPITGTDIRADIMDPSQINNEDLQEITMLRRMRKRK